jgi:hypothetical protein
MVHLIFKPKIPIWVNVRVSFDGRCWFKYFIAIWDNLLQFGIVCGHLVYISHFGMFGPRKIWQPWHRDKNSSQVKITDMILPAPGACAVIRGRCYDHNFRRFLPIFCDFCQFSAKKLSFFSKTNVVIKIFA